MTEQAEQFVLPHFLPEDELELAHLVLDDPKLNQIFLDLRLHNPEYVQRIVFNAEEAARDEEGNVNSERYEEALMRQLRLLSLIRIALARGTKEQSVAFSESGDGGESEQPLVAPHDGQ